MTKTDFDASEIYALQSRWQIEGKCLYYYGLRNGDQLHRNRVRITKAQLAILSSLPRALSHEERRRLGGLLGCQVVPQSKRRQIPRSFAEASFCKCCCANDFMIPGLELDGEGLCPMCRTAEETKSLKSVVPLVEGIPHAKKSRFDIALFYTGGKDSTFLLYYLSKVKKLRVLALTWEIPFLSESAKRSIEGAKRAFDNVEFITRAVSRRDLETVYRGLYTRSGNTCACPSLAYLLFYPELVANRVPYFAAGNEPVQMLGLYYNRMAPKIAYSFADNAFLNGLLNLGRLLTLRPPLKRGQFHTLMTMKQLAYGDHPVKRLSGYENELVKNVVEAIHEVPSLLPPFRRAIRYSSRTGRIPAFVHFDLNQLCGGVYDWNRVKEILVRECGWCPPDAANKALHTSCEIERCKDHTQFLRFYHCKSKMIPFSALEISLASRNCGRTREEMIYEMEHLLGFSLSPIPECATMRAWIGAEK